MSRIQNQTAEPFLIYAWLSGPGIVVRGKHQLTIARPAVAARLYRKTQEAVFYPPVLRVFQPVHSTLPHSTHSMQHASRPVLRRELPRNVLMVSLEAWQDNRSMLVRLGQSRAQIMTSCGLGFSKWRQTI